MFHNILCFVPRLNVRFSNRKLSNCHYYPDGQDEQWNNTFITGHDTIPSRSSSSSSACLTESVTFLSLHLDVLERYSLTMDTRLRHCATSRKFAGSIPDDVIGIFHWHGLSCRAMALGSTQPLTDVFPGGGRCLGLSLTTFMCRLSSGLWALTPWNPVDL